MRSVVKMTLLAAIPRSTPMNCSPLRYALPYASQRWTWIKSACAGVRCRTGAEERPNHAHGRAGHRAAADPDRISIAHERGRLFERDDLVAQTSVAAQQFLAQLQVGGNGLAGRFAVVRCHAGSRSAPGADLRVEILYQAIPRRYPLHDTAPEPLVPSAIEIVDRHALLFHPSVISEIENTLAIASRELETVTVRT